MESTCLGGKSLAFIWILSVGFNFENDLIGSIFLSFLPFFDVQFAGFEFPSVSSSLPITAKRKDILSSKNIVPTKTSYNFLVIGTFLHFNRQKPRAPRQSSNLPQRLFSDILSICNEVECGFFTLFTPPSVSTHRKSSKIAFFNP